MHHWYSSQFDLTLNNSGNETEFQRLLRYDDINATNDTFNCAVICVLGILKMKRMNEMKNTKKQLIADFQYEWMVRSSAIIALQFKLNFELKWARDENHILDWAAHDFSS